MQKVEEVNFINKVKELRGYVYIEKEVISWIYGVGLAAKRKV